MRHPIGESQRDSGLQPAQGCEERAFHELFCKPLEINERFEDSSWSRKQVGKEQEATLGRRKTDFPTATRLRQLILSDARATWATPPNVPLPFPLECFPRLVVSL